CLSILAASFSSAGFPKIWLSMVTTVSAEMIIDCESREATSMPFSRATRMAKVAGSSPGAGVSSMEEGTTVHGYPRMASSSLRRGDCEAKTRFMGLFALFWNIQQSAMTVSFSHNEDQH